LRVGGKWEGRKNPLLLNLKARGSDQRSFSRPCKGGEKRGQYPNVQALRRTGWGYIFVFGGGGVHRMGGVLKKLGNKLPKRKGFGGKEDL